MKPVSLGRLYEALLEAKGMAAGDTGSPSEAGSSGDGIPGMCTAAKRLRVLVNDDNAVNREVIRRHLEHWGHEPTLVENGALAVEAFETGAFDLVLMDIQTPEMDGCEATQKIRALGTARALRTPIVALTADALEENHRRYVEAGMNAVIIKPMTAESLRAVIDRVAAGSSNPLMYQEDTSVTGDLDVRHVQEITGGDVELLVEITDLYTESSTSALAELRSAIRSGEAAKVEERAHYLSGLIRNFGNGMAGVLARQLEDAGQSGVVPADAPSLVDELEARLADLDRQLREYMRNRQK
jgi:protein-histidine pros-kinase